LTRQQLEGDLYELTFIASVNQRYHQLLRRRFTIAERSVRIVIGIIACISLALSIAAGPWVPATAASSVYISIPAIIASFFGLVAAFILNIVPIDKYERTHDTLFRRWTSLQRDARELDLRLAQTTDQQQDELRSIANAYRSLVRRMHEIEIDEPAPYRRLLLRCHEDENERHWGVRTNAEVEALKQKRMDEAFASQSPSP